MIHALVGALRGKNRRDEQLERVFVLQRAGSRRIRLVEPLENCSHARGIGSTSRLSCPAPIFAERAPADFRAAEFLSPVFLIFFRAMSAKLYHSEGYGSTRTPFQNAT